MAEGTRRYVPDLISLEQRRALLEASRPKPQGWLSAVLDPEFWRRDIPTSMAALPERGGQAAFGASAATLGFPVDVMGEMALRPAGQLGNTPPEEVVGSSAWFGKQMKPLGADPSRTAYQVGMFGPTPDAMDIPRLMARMDPNTVMAMMGAGAIAPKTGVPDVPSTYLQPTDRPRVDWPTSPQAPRELTRTVKGHEGRVSAGAPAGVSTVQKQTAIVNNYLQGALEGIEGRLWYDTVAKHLSETTGNVGGARPGAQDVAAAVLSGYSPRATLPANRLAEVRAEVQHATGRPIAAGMGPRNEAARSALEQSILSNEGLKTSPFAMQVRGLKAPRGVHDTRDLQAWGFEQGFSPSEANHRWMDQMMDRAVDRANEMKLGGFDDWTHERLQAARWVKHKSDEGGEPISELAKAFGPIDERLTANIYSEAIPSAELSELLGMAPEAKTDYTRRFNEALATREGQDALALQMGLQTPPGGGLGVGEWQGMTNPNIRTRVLVDPEKGSDVISEAGKEAVDFRAALSGLFGGQTDTAFSYGRPAKGAGRENFAVVDLGRPVTGQDLTDYRTRLEAELPAGHTIIPNIRSATSIELTSLEGGKDWRRAVEKVAPNAQTGINTGGLTLGSAERFKPSEWMTKLQNPTLRASVKQMIPQAAEKIQKLVETLPLSQTGKDVYLKTVGLLRTGGLEAVEDAVKAGILPAFMLAIILQQSEPGPLSGPSGASGPLPPHV